MFPDNLIWLMLLTLAALYTTVHSIPDSFSRTAPELLGECTRAPDWQTGEQTGCMAKSDIIVGEFASKKSSGSCGSWLSID